MSADNVESHLVQVEALVGQAESTLNRYEELRDVLELLEKHKKSLDDASAKELQSDLVTMANEISAITEDPLFSARGRALEEVDVGVAIPIGRPKAPVSRRRRTYV